MKKRFVYILTSLLLLGLSACKKSELQIPDVKAETDGAFITLEQPITLSLMVSPVRVDDGSRLRAVGDFSRDYSVDDRKNATVNSPKGTTTGDSDYDKLLKGGLIDGMDWVRDIYIPELKESDYKVVGLVPLPAKLSDVGGFLDPAMQSGYTPPEKVTITFSKLPADGKLTFLVNAKVGSTYYGQDDNVVHLSTDNPFLVTTSPRFQLSDKLRDEMLQENKQRVRDGFEPNSHTDRLNISSSLFECSYLPMYSRLYHVTPNAEKNGLVGSETEGGRVARIETIYLERAVSFVSITYDTPTRNTPYFFNEVDFGRYPNVTSVIPNNQAALKAHMISHTVEPFTKENPGILRYGTIEKSSMTWSESTPFGIATFKTGTHTFFMPENIADSKEHQSTLYVQLSEMDFDMQEYVGPLRKIKVHIPFGEKNSTTGLLDIHRNTWYKLHLKLKPTPTGVVPYIVDTWTNQDVDLPW